MHHNLIRLLQWAHAGERAAAHAYRGHARSLGDDPAAAWIQRIEAEEWEHRRILRGLLARLDARPDPLLEAGFAVIGRIVSAACHVSGRFWPMFIAGRLEAVNVGEYERLAAAVAGTPLADAAATLRHLAEVEDDHAWAFRRAIRRHPLRVAAAWLFDWGLRGGPPRPLGQRLHAWFVRPQVQP
jgi:rubrerythrin